MRHRYAVVVLSKDDQRFDRFMRRIITNVSPADADRFSVLRISDARSACEGYNRAIEHPAAKDATAFVFVHDDVEILTRDFFERCDRHLEHLDVFGVAGTSNLLDGCWTSGGPESCAGAVLHAQGDRLRLVCYGSSDNAKKGGAQALDGVLIVAERYAAEAVRFDEETFDGWHFYDVDFSYRADLFVVGVVDDLLVLHHGEGDFLSPEWQKYRERFERKHSFSPVENEHEIASIDVASVEEARRIFEMGVRDFVREWHEERRARKAKENMTETETQAQTQQPPSDGKVRLDLGCGRNPRPGFDGVDIAPLPGVKHVHNLLDFPWPFADESVDEIFCSHFIEHIPMLFWTPPKSGYIDFDGSPFDWVVRLSSVQINEHSVELLLKFFSEVYRILKPGGRALFVSPQAHNDRAFQDPSHRRFIVPATYYYLDAKWRAANGLEHAAYSIRCDFPMELAKIEPTYSAEQQEKLQTMHPDAVLADMRHSWNTTEDLAALLVKPSSNPETESSPKS